jgi:hypothetical protein
MIIKKVRPVFVIVAQTGKAFLLKLQETTERIHSALVFVNPLFPPDDIVAVFIGRFSEVSSNMKNVI